MRVATLSLFFALFIASASADPDWRIENPLTRPVDDICMVSKHASGIPAKWMWDGCSFAGLSATSFGPTTRSSAVGEGGRLFGLQLEAAGSSAGAPSWSGSGDASRPMSTMYGHKDTLFVAGRWDDDVSSDWAYISAGTFAPLSGTTLRGDTVHSLFQLPSNNASVEVMMPLWVSDNFGDLDDDVQVGDTNEGDIVYLVAGSTGEGHARTMFLGAPNVSPGAVNSFASGGSFAVPDSSGLGRTFPIGAARYDMDSDPLNIKDDENLAGIKAIAWIIGLAIDEDNENPHMQYQPVYHTVIMRDSGAFELLSSGYLLGSDSEYISSLTTSKFPEDPAPVGFSYGSGFTTLTDGDDFMMLSWFVPDYFLSYRHNHGSQTGTTARIKDRDVADLYEMHNVLIEKRVLELTASAVVVDSDSIIAQHALKTWTSACLGSLFAGEVKCLLAPSTADPLYSETSVLAKRGDNQWEIVYYPDDADCEGCDLDSFEQRERKCDPSCTALGNIPRKTGEELGVSFFTVTINRNALTSLGYVTNYSPDKFESYLVGAGGYQLTSYVHEYQQITWTAGLDFAAWGSAGAKAGGVILLGGVGTSSYKRSKRRKKASNSSSKTVNDAALEKAGTIENGQESSAVDETALLKRTGTGLGGATADRPATSVGSRKSRKSRNSRGSRGSKVNSPGSHGSRNSRNSRGSRGSKGTGRSAGRRSSKGSQGSLRSKGSRSKPSLGSVGNVMDDGPTPSNL